MKQARAGILGGIHWGTCETRFYEAVSALTADSASAVRLVDMTLDEKVFVPAEEADEEAA
jgi:hypothetical protein